MAISIITDVLERAWPRVDCAHCCLFIEYTELQIEHEIAPPKKRKKPFKKGPLVSGCRFSSMELDSIWLLLVRVNCNCGSDCYCVMLAKLNGVDFC